MKKLIQPPADDPHQTVMEISTTTGKQSIRIGFTDQQLSAYGGMAVWSGFVQKRDVRGQLKKVMPNTPVSPPVLEAVS